MFENIAIIEGGLKNAKIWWFEEIRRHTNNITLIQPYDISWEFDYVDDFIPCSYQNWNDDSVRIAHALTEKNIDVIFPLCEGTTKYGNDLRHILNFPPITGIDASYYTNKQKMRNYCKNKGLHQPKLHSIDGDSLTTNRIDDMPFPVVVKPAEMMGSIGVKLVENKTQLIEATKLAEIVDFPGEDLRKRYNSSEQVLVEEFIFGKEYSIECAVRNRITILTMITEKFKSKLPYFDEIGHIANPPLEDDLSVEIATFTNQIIRNMQFRNGICHIEIICNESGIYLVEIAARPAGCWIPYIHMLGGGFNIVQLILSTLSNKHEMLDLNVKNDPAGVFFPFVTNDNKTLSRQLMAALPSPPEGLLPRRKIVYETIGDAFVVPGNITERIGMIIVTGDYDVMHTYFEQLSAYCTEFNEF